MQSVLYKLLFFNFLETSLDSLLHWCSHVKSSSYTVNVRVLGFICEFKFIFELVSEYPLRRSRALIVTRLVPPKDGGVSVFRNFFLYLPFSHSFLWMKCECFPCFLLYSSCCWFPCWFTMEKYLRNVYSIESHMNTSRYTHRCCT